MTELIIDYSVPVALFLTVWITLLAIGLLIVATRGVIEMIRDK